MTSKWIIIPFFQKSIEYSSSSRLKVTTYNKYSSRQKWKFNWDGTVISKYSGRKMYISSSSSGATVTTSSSSSSSSKLKWSVINPSAYGKSPFFPWVPSDLLYICFMQYGNFFDFWCVVFFPFPFKNFSLNACHF